MKQKRTGFTLIELLTVIAIIGILAAILIPILGSVRDSARAAQCVSNLRSTTTAMLSHISENDGVMITFRGGSETHRIWPHVLSAEGYFEFRTNHYANESIVCPSWEYREQGHHFDGYGLNVFDPEAAFYNPSQSGGGPNASMYSRNFNDSRINPSRYILFADSLRGPGGRQVFRLWAQTANANGAVHLRHKDRANVAFLDGHVASHGANSLGKLEPELRSGYAYDGTVVEFPGN